MIEPIKETKFRKMVNSVLKTDKKQVEENKVDENKPESCQPLNPQAPEDTGNNLDIKA